MVSFEEKYGEQIDFVNIDFNLRHEYESVKNFGEKFGIEAHPMTIFIDTNGETKYFSGFNPADATEKIEEVILDLLQQGE